MAKTYTVASPLVVVTNPEQGNRQEYLYQGLPVPSFVDSDQVKRLVDEGHIVDDEALADDEGGAPGKSASKADWVAYAVSQGVPEDEAEAATRDELVARFTA